MKGLVGRTPKRILALAVGVLAVGTVLWAPGASAEPVGLIEEFDIGGSAIALVAGPDGNLWLAAGEIRPAIARVSTVGAISVFSAGLSPQNRSLGPLVAGSDGNVWFTARGLEDYSGGKRTTVGYATRSVGSRPPARSPSSGRASTRRARRARSSPGPTAGSGSPIGRSGTSAASRPATLPRTPSSSARRCRRGGVEQPTCRSRFPVPESSGSNRSPSSRGETD